MKIKNLALISLTWLSVVNCGKESDSTASNVNERSLSCLNRNPYQKVILDESEALKNWVKEHGSEKTPCEFIEESLTNVDQSVREDIFTAIFPSMKNKPHDSSVVLVDGESEFENQKELAILVDMIIDSKEDKTSAIGLIKIWATIMDRYINKDGEENSFPEISSLALAIHDYKPAASLKNRDNKKNNYSLIADFVYETTYGIDADTIPAEDFQNLFILVHSFLLPESKNSGYGSREYTIVDLHSFRNHKPIVFINKFIKNHSKLNSQQILDIINYIKLIQSMDIASRAIKIPEEVYDLSTKEGLEKEETKLDLRNYYELSMLYLAEFDLFANYIDIKDFEGFVSMGDFSHTLSKDKSLFDKDLLNEYERKLQAYHKANEEASRIGRILDNMVYTE